MSSPLHGPGIRRPGAGTIILVRHGRTRFNAEGRLQGQIDIELDETGIEQARLGAAALAEHYQPDRLVTSDLIRAHDTAAAYAEVTGSELIVDERLRERGFGIWEGKSGQELHEEFPEEFERWRAGLDSPIIGAEPRDASAARIAEALREHAAATKAGGVLVVVSHGAAISGGITNMLGLDAGNWRGLTGLNNVHWARLERSRPDATPPWRLTGFNIGW
ncbi:histidine phosphatase family protein [Rarobacter faecitabidus]|uniref:Putative phosphoglycerate mutase n=1 Tax=Rarobacter faecitabidus TaxID=13243 RepID=A0A542ZUT3_RARFA|nr:histidine phosphatase family protein [Rarobacter faecitabidus]TQL64114.1 putative phosphoglycerate mutase [Rarobacter faecitabidus]